MDNKKIGVLGEKWAVDFLKNRNYNIVAINYRCRYGEIDIIARQRDTIVFVEVKTRNSMNFGRGLEAVNYLKQQKIKKVALDFLSKQKTFFPNMRFDVIDIMVKGEDHIEINHIKNAF